MISLTFQDGSCLALKMEYEDMSTDLINWFLRSENLIGNWRSFDRRVSLVLLSVSIKPLEPISMATSDQSKPTSMMSDTRDE